jgi:hypothetical protein
MCVAVVWQPVIAGLDTENKPYLFASDFIGAPLIPDMESNGFVVSGTCTEQLFGMCESMWKPGELGRCYAHTVYFVCPNTYFNLCAETNILFTQPIFYLSTFLFEASHVLKYFGWLAVACCCVPHVPVSKHVEQTNVPNKKKMQPFRSMHKRMGKNVWAKTVANTHVFAYTSALLSLCSYTQTYFLRRFLKHRC